MRAQLALLVAAALLARVGGAGCPAGCTCVGGVEPYVACSGLTVRGQRAIYAKIECDTKELQESGLTCAIVPPWGYGSGDALDSLSVHYCPLSDETSLACAARALGATRVRALTLDDCRGAGGAGGAGVRLQREHVAGLQGVRELSLVVVDDGEVSVSAEALAQLPELASLVVTGGRARLSPEWFPAPGAPLRYLEVSGAHVARVPDGYFRNLPHLRRLSLTRNDIQNLTERTFEGLSSLRLLDLSSNQLRALPPAVLAPVAGTLTNLSVYANPLGTLDTLSTLTNLEGLIVYENLVPLIVSARALAGMPRLRAVSLSQCGIAALPRDALADSRDIRTLDLSRNTLSDLPHDLLRDQSHLTTLDLSENKLQALPADLLASLRDLEELKLDDNKLTELPPGLLEGLGRLASLSASGNRLRTLSGAVFQGAFGLTTLVLARNQLAFNETDDDQVSREATTAYFNLGAASPFNALTRLRRLDLSGNRITAMFDDLPIGLLQLETLDLSHNRIAALDGLSNQLNFFSQIVTVDVRYNNISDVRLCPAEDRVGPHPLAGVLLLDDNPLACDCVLFQLARRLHGYPPPPPLSELRFVADDARCAQPARLAGARVRDVPLADFVCELPGDGVECAANCSCTLRPAAAALEVLCPAAPRALPDSGGQSVVLRVRSPPASLAALPAAVRVLNLTGLGLTAAPPGPVPATLRELDLTDNALVAAPPHLLESNATLRLAGNPLACDCWHAAEVAALQAAEARVADYGALACVGGAPLATVNSEQLCVTWAAGLAGGLLAGLGLLAAAAAVLVYRYSLELRVLLYSRRWCRRWVRRREAALDRDKMYDAFVSFAHEDTAFVLEELLPRLEAGPRPFALCVHCRDWVAGEWIPAQIARSVEASRRTVVVLSRNFLRSVWGRLEFRAAHMAAVSEARSRVVVVLLEDVDTDPEMDAELRAYLATNTYLRWGERWFWDKLRYALPHREDEDRIQAKGRELMQRAVKGEAAGGFGLRAHLTPDGKIINAAIKAPPPV